MNPSARKLGEYEDARNLRAMATTVDDLRAMAADYPEDHPIHGQIDRALAACRRRDHYALGRVMAEMGGES